MNSIVIALIGLLVAVPPLFFIEHDSGKLNEEFQAVMLINAELKYSIVLTFTSIICGIVIGTLYFKNKIIHIPKPLVYGIGIFLTVILLSTLLAHNFQRAWIASFQLYLLPLLLVFSLLHLSLDHKKTTIFLSMVIISGSISCFITLDQHYIWTDWSQKFPRVNNNYSGIIYNQNFAAEYHILFIAPTIGMFFLVKSKFTILILITNLLLLLLPATAISLARGAWLGLIGGNLGVSLLFIIILLLNRSKLPSKNLKIALLICFLFFLLSFLLLVFIQYSDLWKKEGKIYELLKQINIIFIPLIIFLILNIFNFAKKSHLFSRLKKNRNKIVLTVSIILLVLFSVNLSDYILGNDNSKELEEFKSIIETGSERRLHLWNDALNECISNDTFLGKGSNHYEVHYHESAKISDSQTGSFIITYTHNDFIQIFFENGIIGLLSFLFVWAYIIFLGLQSALQHAKQENYPFVAVHLALIASTLAYLITMFFEFPSRMPSSMILGWTLLGLSLSLSLKYRKEQVNPVQTNKLFKFILGIIALFTIPYGCTLGYNLFWGNLYYQQARLATQLANYDTALDFDRKSTYYTPWLDRSRKWECFLLMTQKKEFEKALTVANDTISVHPGSLNSHQYKINLLLNKLGRKEEAKKAYLEMKKIAPYHEYTKNVGKDFQ